jgi:hypothetical protein
MLPHPNLRVLASNIRFFVDHHTIGLFEQGDARCSAGDFVRMKNWVLSHLMWNPALDETKLFDDFLNGYYGNDAAPLLKEYWNLLLDCAEQSGVYLDCHRQSTNDWLDIETLNKAVALMNRAIEITIDETVRNRLRREKISVDLVVLKEYNTFRRKAELTGTPFIKLENPQHALDDFFARCKEFGVTVYSEQVGVKGFKIFEQKLRQSLGRVAIPPDFCKDLPKNNWYEIQNYQLNTLKLGELTFDIDNEKASNGQAVKMPGDHFQWATTYVFDDALLDLKPATTTTEQPKYRLYASVRCDAKTTKGTAMTLGVHDSKEKKGITNKSIVVSEISGTEYHWIDMGSIALKPEQYIWFAPPKRPNEVDAVYIDRIVVVRE